MPRREPHFARIAAICSLLRPLRDFFWMCCKGSSTVAMGGFDRVTHRRASFPTGFSQSYPRLVTIGELYARHFESLPDYN
jgi:hypothetical protein